MVRTGPKLRISRFSSAPVVVVVHLQPMPVGGDEAAAARCGVLGGNAARASGVPVRRLRLGDDGVGDQLALVVGEPPHAAVGLHKAGREQAFMLGMDRR